MPLRQLITAPRGADRALAAKTETEVGGEPSQGVATGVADEFDGVGAASVKSAAFSFVSLQPVRVIDWAGLGPGAAPAPSKQEDAWLP